MEAMMKLNFFPPKGGVSKYYSPQEILHHEKLDYMKQCSIPQFAYIQADDEPNPKPLKLLTAFTCIHCLILKVDMS
jgi:hypothetical protein